MPPHNENMYDAISGLAKPKVIALILRMVIISPVKTLAYSSSTTSLVVVILAAEGGDLIMLRFKTRCAGYPGRYPGTFRCVPPQITNTVWFIVLILTKYNAS